MKKTLHIVAIACTGLIGTLAMAQCPGSFAVTLYSTDFEANDGGFVESGGGDWEYGAIPNIIAGANCESATFSSPGGAYSGTKGWATILNDCYHNLGALSSTGFTVDLSDPALLSTKLDFAHWFEVFVAWDYLTITANGTEIYRNDSTEDSNTWMHTSVDLTPYLGQQSVVIKFNLWATTVVNRAGWYLDDVTVTACSNEPTAIADPVRPMFKAWPVPATEVLNIEASPAMGPVLGWSLFDATGRMIAEGTPGSDPSGFSIDVSAFQGLAVLELRTMKGHHRQQVILE